jgi:hypothetical protein
MPTNANTFNSRVTSEALEAKYRQVFPAQGGAELVQDLFASGVIQPVVDFSTVAEGSVLSQNLQTAWDFSITHLQAENNTQTLANTPGFYKCSVVVSYVNAAGSGNVLLGINDGLATKTIWQCFEIGAGSNNFFNFQYQDIVYLRAGDSLVVTSSQSGVLGDGTARQIADVNGNLVNPLGFTFQ